jgi:hypothetical protein
MIKITYNQISNYDLVSAIQKIANTQLPIKVAYNVKKLVDQMTIARKKIGEEYQKEVVDLFAVKEEGKPDSIPDDKKEEMEKAQAAFGEKIVEIDRPKIHVHEIQNVQLTVRELSAIDALIADEGDANKAIASVTPIGGGPGAA